MKDTKVERARRSAAMLRRQFLHGGGLFDQVLDDLLDAHGKPSRDRVYPPLDTLRLFIGQVLSADRACQDVVGRRLSERLAHGQPASALNTGSYCDARSRLPLAMPTTLGSLIGERLESAVPLQWHWQGRTVKLFDGTTVSMPDTPNNQQAWPQSREQKPGLGFPIARIGVHHQDHAADGCAALQIAGDGGERDRSLFARLQPGALGGGENGSAHGCATPCVEFYWRSASIGRLLLAQRRPP